jgi:hypothetical protein
MYKIYVEWVFNLDILNICNENKVNYKKLPCPHGKFAKQVVNKISTFTLYIPFKYKWEKIG